MTAGVKSAPSPTDKVHVLTFTIGSRVLGVPDERAWAFAGGAYYEHNVDAWLGALLAGMDRPVFYDVGANIGYYSLRAAAAGARHVYAFEPVSTTYATMRRNLESGGPEGVTALKLGISARAGFQRIQLFSSSGSNSLFHRELPAGHPHRELGNEPIELATIDELVSRGITLAPDVIKLDIEGGELAALQGARTVLSTHMPCLVMEVSEEICAHAGHRPEDVLDELRALGYELWGLSARTDDLTAHPVPSPGVENIVAVAPGTALPSREELERARAQRPQLSPTQRYQAVFARSYRTRAATAALREPISTAAATVLRELAQRRGHGDLVAGCAAGDLLAELRSHVRGIVAVDRDQRRVERAARRFAADPGVRVEAGEPSTELTRILAHSAGPPLVWLGAPAAAAEAAAVLDAVARAPHPAGTTFAVGVADSSQQQELARAAVQAFPSAGVIEGDGVVIVEA